MSLIPEPIAPPSSWLSSFDPRWRLISFGVLILSISLLQHWPGLLMALCLSLLLAVIARLPFKSLLARVQILLLMLAPFALLLPLTLPGESAFAIYGLEFSQAGCQLAIVTGLKATNIVLLATILLHLAPVQTTLCAAGKLGVPALLVQLAAMSYRYIFLFRDELSRIRIALRTRGFRNRMDRHSYVTIGQVSGTLLVHGYERAERVSQAMLCRGFQGRFRSMQEFQTRLGDLVQFVVALVTAALLQWGDRPG